MIIYPLCPNCSYQAHLSLFGKDKINREQVLICPNCGQKFKFVV